MPISVQQSSNPRIISPSPNHNPKKTNHARFIKNLNGNDPLYLPVGVAALCGEFLIGKLLAVHPCHYRLYLVDGISRPIVAATLELIDVAVKVFLAKLLVSSDVSTF